MSCCGQRLTAGKHRLNIASCFYRWYRRTIWYHGAQHEPPAPAIPAVDLLHTRPTLRCARRASTSSPYRPAVMDPSRGDGALRRGGAAFSACAGRGPAHVSAARRTPVDLLIATAYSAMGLISRAGLGPRPIAEVAWTCCSGAHAIAGLDGDRLARDPAGPRRGLRVLIGNRGLESPVRAVCGRCCCRRPVVLCR
jgi:hypothetical protein